jgi:hypothetical protein
MYMDMWGFPNTYTLGEHAQPAAAAAAARAAAAACAAGAAVASLAAWRCAQQQVLAPEGSSCAAALPARGFDTDYVQFEKPWTSACCSFVYCSVTDHWSGVLEFSIMSGRVMLQART